MKMLEIIIIIVSVVYIWEHSGFVFDMSKFVYEKLNKGKKYKGQPILKPFGCYTCMIFWLVGIFAYVSMGLPIILTIGLSVSSCLVGILVDKILMIIIRVINKIE